MKIHGGKLPPETLPLNDEAKGEETRGAAA
jgi:hypothetical protein